MNYTRPVTMTDVGFFWVADDDGSVWQGYSFRCSESNKWMAQYVGRHKWVPLRCLFWTKAEAEAHVAVLLAGRDPPPVLPSPPGYDLSLKAEE